MMGKIWLATAAAFAALIAPSANATIWNFDFAILEGGGVTPSDTAHLVVDDYWGGTMGNPQGPTGIWTYGHGDYFGLYQDAFVDLYNDNGGGGVTLTPYLYDPLEDSNNPDFDWMLDLYGPSTLFGSGIQAGVYNFTDWYGDMSVRLTISEAEASAAPEPANWVMMLTGFGLVGGALRQRKRAIVSFG